MTWTAHPPDRRRGHRAHAASSGQGQHDRRLRIAPSPPADGTPADDGGPELTLEVRRDGARPLVAVAGELDLGGQELFEAVLSHVRSTDPGTIEVDLSRVTFANTHGLTPALEQDVVLVAVSPAVRRLMHLLGLRVPRTRPLRRALG